MDRFLEMQTFTAVVDAGSFVRASETLGLSKAAVSRHLADLEERLGVRLLQRSTRRLALTEDGQLFYARARELLAGLAEAEAELATRSGEALGLLRINAPPAFGVRHLAPLWGAFRERNPRVVLEVILSDRLIDPIEEGFDIAIRIGELTSSNLIARRLATTRRLLCASPDYLDRHGWPRTPDELAGHQVISYGHYAARSEWHFDGPHGLTSVRIDACIYTNSGETCRAAALAHQGIVLQPSYLVGDALRSGALVELMPEFHSDDLGIFALYPSRKHLPAKVRALIEFLAASLAVSETRW
jgi:DNA-binding transcriptional LysR family regulator